MLAGEAGLRPLTARDFRLFQTLIHREAGIHLAEHKSALLVGRLARRLRALGIASFREYYDRVAADPAERTVLIDSICTHETRFYREPRQFEFLERTILPGWRAEADQGRRARRVRAWSAGCSSGEEPWSIAMSLLACLPPSEGWAVEVVATDLSTRILAQARAAVYPAERVADIPDLYLRRFWERRRVAGRDMFTPGAALRATVRFERCNLHAPDYPLPGGRFDLVFCRNVLIYFDGPTKLAVIERLFGHLDPAGYLFLGHAESLHGLMTRPRNVMPTVYAHPGR